MKSRMLLRLGAGIKMSPDMSVISDLTDCSSSIPLIVTSSRRVCVGACTVCDGRRHDSSSGLGGM